MGRASASSRPPNTGTQWRFSTPESYAAPNWNTPWVTPSAKVVRRRRSARSSSTHARHGGMTTLNVCQTRWMSHPTLAGRSPVVQACAAMTAEPPSPQRVGFAAGADRIRGACSAAAGAPVTCAWSLGLNLFSQCGPARSTSPAADPAHGEYDSCGARTSPLWRRPGAHRALRTRTPSTDAMKLDADAADCDDDSCGRCRLPIDPRDVGRTYEAVIGSTRSPWGQPSSHHEDRPHSLPRRLQIEFSQVSRRSQRVQRAGWRGLAKKSWTFAENYRPNF